MQIRKYKHVYPMKLQESSGQDTFWELRDCRQLLRAVVAEKIDCQLRIPNTTIDFEPEV